MVAPILHEIAEERPENRGMGKCQIEPVGKLGHGLGVDDKKIILLGPQGFIIVNLIGEGNKNISRLQLASHRIGVRHGVSFKEADQLDLTVQVRGAAQIGGLVVVLGASEGKIRVSFFITQLILRHRCKSLL